MFPDKDLNLDQQDQNLMCYRYTIGENEKNVNIIIMAK